MPWKPEDAEKHTRKVEGRGPAARQWAHVADGVRQRMLDSGASAEEADAAAVREANGVAADRRPATHAHPSKAAATPHGPQTPRSRS